MADDFNLDNLIESFIYSGSKLKMDISLVEWKAMSEVDRLIDDLVYEKAKMIRYDGLAERAADREIRKIIREQSGPFKAWLNRQDRIIAEMTNKLTHQPVIEFDKKNPGLIYGWKLGVVKTTHCPDCKMLSEMKPRTIDEWRDVGFGLPREGYTECKQGCKCSLKPIGEAGAVSDAGEVKPTGFVPAKTVKWSPKMSKQDIAIWQKDSVFKQTVYHGTANDFADGIVKNGFEIDRFSAGKFFGDGAYFGHSKKGREFADFFSTLIEGNRVTSREYRGAILECKLNVKKVFDAGMMEDFDKIVKDKIAKFFNLSIDDVRPNHITDYMKKNGYDALKVVERQLGEDYPVIVVFDKKNITVSKIGKGSKEIMDEADYLAQKRIKDAFASAKDDSGIKTSSDGGELLDWDALLGD